MDNAELVSGIEKLKNKARTRELLRPLYDDYFYRRLSLDALRRLPFEELRLPCVVKPSVGFFSLGVRIVRTREDWLAALAAIEQEATHWREQYPDSVVDSEDWLIEEYIDGDEYAVDVYFDAQGQAVICNILRHEFASASDVSDRLYYTGASVVRSHLAEFEAWFNKVNSLLGLRNFPTHVELRRDAQGRIRPIEFNALRFAGWCCTDVTLFSWGFHTYGCFLEGRRPDWDKALAGREGKLYTLIVLNKPENCPPVRNFDYEALSRGFARVLHGREVNLVDDEQVGLGDAGAALARDFVPAAHIDDIDGEVCQFRAERGGEVVSAAFHQHQLKAGMAGLKLFNCLNVHGGVFADGGMRAAARFNADDAVGLKGVVTQQKFCILAGINVVGDDSHGAAGRLQKLVGNAQGQPARQRAPEVAHAAKHHDHEGIHNVGLAQIGANVGNLAQGHASHASHAGAKAECQCVHARGAYAHAAGNGPVLRYGAHFKPQPGAVHDSGGSARKGQHVGVVHLIGRDNAGQNLHVFVQALLGEERTQRAVDQAGNQGFALGRTADFTAEEAAGDAASGVHFFGVFNGKGEEALVEFKRLRAHGDKHHGTAALNPHRAVGLIGHTACFKDNFLAADHGCNPDGFKNILIHKNSFA